MAKRTDSTAKETIDTMISSLGPIMDLLKEDGITDVMYNATSNIVFYDDADGQHEADFTFEAGQARSFLNAVASYYRTKINERRPKIAARLPEKLFECRLQGYVYPQAFGPQFTLRKPGDVFPLDDYVNEQSKQILIQAIKGRKNIAVAGSTGAGKTSFLNALVNELNKVSPKDRLVILEDQHEIQCEQRNHSYLFVHKDEDDNIITSMGDNVKNSLRDNPDRIIVGEVRKQDAAASVIEAWNTGHEGGFCTYHASDAKQAYRRLYGLAGFDWGNELLQQDTIDALDYIVFLSKENGLRAVREIATVEYNHNDNKPDFTMIYEEEAA